MRHGDAAEDGGLSEAGREQSRLIGQRLAGVALAAIGHSPLRRAAETAELLAAHLPGVPAQPSDLLGDYIPPAPDTELLRSLPASYAAFVEGCSPAELAEGSTLATAALERYAVRSDDDIHELVVTHNQVIGWFVRAALDAPPWRWMGVNQCNGALTTILYRPGRPASLLTFNDMSHLPPALRWTGFPPELVSSI